MKNLLIVLSLFITFFSQSQTVLVDQHFSNTSPSTWTSTSNVWNFNNNGTPTGNYRNVFDNTKYAARFPSASNGNSIYVYIPINFKKDSIYTITFYTKRACSITVNTNELPNQTTLLSTETKLNSDCNSNWNTWYEWSFTTVSTYTGTGYFQIWVKTVYGGPASVYLDDVTITESSPSALPIELLYFKGRKSHNGNILQWETASEYDNDYFTVYCSNYPIKWESIVRIEGAGYSILNNKYEILDSRFANDINYYLLRQTDYNGNYKESEIIAIDNRTPYIEPISVTDMLGREISIDSDVLKIIRYEDGSVVRVY